MCTQAPAVFTGVVTFKSEKQKLCCFLNKGTVSSFQRYKRLFFYYVNINSPFVLCLEKGICNLVSAFALPQHVKSKVQT